MFWTCPRRCCCERRRRAQAGGIALDPPLLPVAPWGAGSPDAEGEEDDDGEVDDVDDEWRMPPVARHAACRPAAALAFKPLVALDVTPLAA